MSKFSTTLLLLAVLTISSGAKDAPTQVINWPATGSTIVRVTLGKFKEISSVSSQRNYVIDTTAENLWSKKISRMGFNLYLYDKNKVRIGDAWITLENIAPGGSGQIRDHGPHGRCPCIRRTCAQFASCRIATAGSATKGLNHGEFGSTRRGVNRGWRTCRYHTQACTTARRKTQPWIRERRVQSLASFPSK